MHAYLLYGLTILLLIGAGGYFVFVSEPNATQPAIADFESCVLAGHYVIDTYPRQCQTVDGMTFFEETISDAMPVTPGTSQEAYEPASAR